MSHENAPVAPIVSSEMVTRHPGFSDEEQRLQLDGSALVADAMHNPDSLGEVVDNKSELRGNMMYTNETTHSVRREEGVNGNPPEFRFTINRSVSPGIDAQAGKVDVLMNSGGQVLYTEAYEAPAYGAPLVTHELTPQEALNVASEALAVVRSHNEEQNRSEQRAA